MADKIKLKPCPFCGGKVTFYGIGLGNEKSWRVECENFECDCFVKTVYFDTKEEAAAAWNRRAKCEN